MGTKDVTTRRLEEYNDVFADIINVLVFDGERQVREDDLIDMDTKTEIVADDKGFRSQERDVAKFWKSQARPVRARKPSRSGFSDATSALQL